MTSRDGVHEPTCLIRVSPEMQALRAEQSKLNYFLWSTQICLGFSLSSSDPRLSDGDLLVSEALSNVSTEAWYPNTAGKIKYNAKVSSFLEQMTVNHKMVARATMTMWYSSFERFLKARLDGVANPSTWGPFTQYCPLCVPTA